MELLRLFSMREQDQRHISGQEAQGNKTEQHFNRYQGKVFQAVIKEDERDGETHLTVGVFDGKEMVVFDFATHVQGYKTFTLTSEEVAASGLPVQAEDTRSSVSPSPERQQTTPEKQGKPTKITGTINSIDQLKKTKKQGRPMLLFTVADTFNHVERRLLAFDSIAEQLAAPGTNLQPHEPITLFAHKHENTIHINGQKRTVEDWYIQSAIYHGKRFEKPKSSKQRDE